MNTEEAIVLGEHALDGEREPEVRNSSDQKS